MFMDITDSLEFLVHTHNGLEQIADETLQSGSNKESWMTNKRHELNKMKDLKTAHDLSRKINEQFKNYIVNPLALASVFYTIDNDAFYEKYSNNQTMLQAYGSYNNGDTVETAETVGEIELIIHFDNNFDTPFYIPVTMRYSTAYYSGTKESVQQVFDDIIIDRISEAKLTNSPQKTENKIGEIVNKSL